MNTFRRSKALLIISTTIAMSLSACGSVFIPSIQPIIGFSASCISAYSSNVDQCKPNDFRGIGGTGACSPECIRELFMLQDKIIRACVGEQASGNTVIGHFFLRDAPQFLCGFTSDSSGSNGGGGTAAATTNMVTTTISASSVTSTSYIASMETIAPTTSTSGSTSSSGSSTFSSSSNSESTTSTASRSSNTIKSTQASQTTTTKTSSTSTSTSSSRTKSGSGGGAQQTLDSGGGSPFDIGLSGSSLSGAVSFRHQGKMWEMVLLSVCVVLGLGWV